MSAQEFKPGDRVRCVDVMGQPSENLKLDDTALYTVASITHHGWLTLTSNPGPWLPSRFVKVDLESTEPEFVVGQQVSGGAYARLPVGSKVSNPNATILTKVDEDGWTRDDGSSTRPHSNKSMRSNFTGRTLTHLPDAPKPEDTDDVEPEPLKEGDWVQVWAQVSRSRSDGDTECRFFYGVKHADGTPKDSFDERVRNDAIVRPDAGQVPPWVKPVEEPTELGTVVFCEEGSVFVRVHACGKRPWGRSGFDEHRSWDEIPAVERVVKGGAS